MADLMRVGGAVIEARGWGWRHSTRSRFAVRGLDLRIEAGQKVLLLGPSGAGKSTLLHALAGVLGADEGEQEGSLEVCGIPASQARGQVGLVLQDPTSQIIVGKVGDDVAFGPESLGIERLEIWRRVTQALDAVGLEVDLPHRTQALSGGQKQRLALAGAIAMGPRLLLLDEPTANLDPQGVLEVRDAVISAQARTGATLVVVEHRVPIWADEVDRIVVLERGGGVRADGSPREVLSALGDQLATEGVWTADFTRPIPLPAADFETSSPLLSARNLTIGYEADKPIQENLDLDILEGISTCIVGHNGAGKSTLALTLAGLLPALGGSVEACAKLRAPNVEFDSQPLASWWKSLFMSGQKNNLSQLPPDPHDWLSRHLLTRIGTVFQAPEHQFVTSTVLGEMTVGSRALGLSQEEAEERALEVLERLNLARLAKANPFTLSGGEKRRLSVATALVASPRLLFLDEPTFGQDLRTWRELISLLKDLLKRGVTLVSVTHDADFISALGQRVISVNTSGVKIER
ncbi:ATP-binding cassette domain-containing protein [Actinomycetaceae bacterium TAE3-ERU4]|nr:ATP-binding cassette domain-containing protein [Actinomycetaceae bacterium TAE3-ERU4]